MSMRTFDPASCTLSWTPSASVGTKYRVVFQATTSTWPKGSGGSDTIIGEFTVVAPLQASAMSRTALADEPEGPNPMHDTFALRTSFVPGVRAELSVFDLSGRRMAVVRGPAGSRIVWNGQGSAGTRVPSGVYLYRLRVGDQQRTGRVAVVR
jgi:hypothetical protein